MSIALALSSRNAYDDEDCGSPASSKLLTGSTPAYRRREEYNRHR
jgi:hypothetical protein